tara:strand:- start:557 stop:1012 length:456 start_codon:yes stop_codon:yes gene_type:complete
MVLFIPKEEEMAYIAKNNKNLILIRGVSGSGKSTFAEEFLYPTSLIISTDDFFMVDGEYQFNPELLDENHDKCFKSVESEMKAPQQDICPNIVVHNTFTQVQEIEPYKELADKYGYNFYTIIVENRHKSNSIHNVPDYVISKQRKRFSVVL